MYKERIIPRKVAAVYHHSGLDLASAWLVTTFFHEEVERFDDSASGLVEKYPNLSDRLEDIRLKMYLPLDCAVEFMDKLPTIELSIMEMRAALVLMKQMANQYPLQVSQLMSPLIKAQEQGVQDWEELTNEARENMPIFVELIGEVFRGVNKYINSHNGTPLEIGQEAMRDVNFRNALFKKGLAGRGWLLGYDIKIASRMGAQTARDNVRKVAMYNSLNKPGKELISSGDFTMIFPSPLEAEQVDGRKLYENILPNMIRYESPESFEALEKVVKEHFTRRVLQVLSV